MERTESIVTWRCEGCGRTLANVAGHIAKVLDGCGVVLYPRVTLVLCPDCGKHNVWRPAK